MFNLRHLTTHSTTVLNYKMAIVLRPQICDVISPYVYDVERWYVRRTESLGVDVERGGGGRRVSEPVLGHALDDAVVSAGADGRHAQDGAVCDPHHRVAVVPVPGRDATAAGAPEVDVRRRVPGRQARERRDAVVDDLLIARRLRDARRV